MNPPAFLFRAALLCEACARAHMAANPPPPWADLDNESTWDSDDWPKGPFPDGGGEADSPCHCDTCGRFLWNPLTPDGAAYVAALFRDGRVRADLADDWRAAYGFALADLDTPEPQTQGVPQ